MTWQTTNTAKGDNKLYSDAKGVVPSLDLRFAEGKTLNDYMTGTPLVDHQRSMGGSNLSPGTFVNSSGLIETAKVNLVSYSQEFENSYYTKANITTMQATTDVAAPDGTFTARYISAASNGRLTISSSNFTSQSGRRKSIYLRAVSGSPVVNALTQAATDPNPVTLSSTEWLRFEIDTPSSEVGGTTFVLDFRGSSTTTEVYAWGLQIEEGSAATTYIPTTDVPSAAPRFDHDPTTSESLGLLIEESRTNLVTYSEQFEDASWGRAGTTSVTPNAAMAPDGSMTADQISLLSINSRISKFDLITTPGQAGTASIYIKNIDHVGSLTLRTNIVGGSAYNKFITLSNEWQRYDLTTVHNGTDNIGITIRETNSNPSGSFLVWGAQVEAGSFPTSYIPTTGTALTRSADVASITGTNFSSWYNQSEGTVYVSGTTAADLSKGALYLISDGTTNNQWSGSFDPSTGYSGSWLLTGNVLQGDLFSLESVSGNQTFKFAASAATNDFKYFTNGAQRDSDLTVTLPTVNRMGIGSDRVNPTGTIRISRLTYFPDRLEDSVLQAITQ